MILLFGEAETLIQVPIAGLVTAAGVIGGALVGAAKMVVAYMERRDAKETTGRAETRTELVAMRAENVVLFREVMQIQRQTVEAMASLQSEIARNSWHRPGEQPTRG